MCKLNVILWEYVIAAVIVENMAKIPTQCMLYGDFMLSKKNTVEINNKKIQKNLKI